MKNQAATTPARPGRKGAFLGLAALAAAGLAAAFLWPSPDPNVLARRASEAFMARDFASAEADLARVHRLRPPTPLDRMLEGQLAIVNGRPDEALVALDRVPDDYPMAAQARLQAGQLELRRSRYSAAERHFLDAVRLDPKSVQARRELIYIYGMQLRRADLGRTFRALSALAPLKYAEVFLWCLSRGVTWEAAEIVETLKKCLEADPTDRWSRLGLAEGLRDLSRPDEAEAALAPLPDSDPLARAARVRIALDRGEDQRAEALLAEGPSDDLDLALLRGRFAQARGDSAEAARQFRIAYQKAPHLREPVLGLGQALKASGDLAAAAPLLDEAGRHERLGTLLQRAAVEQNRDDPILMNDLGDACLALGRLAEARSWYNLAVTRDPLDARAQSGLARVRDREPKSADAPG